MWIKDHFLCIKKVRIEGVEIFPVGFVGACTFQSYVICYMLYVTLEPFFNFDKEKLYASDDTFIEFCYRIVR